VQRHCALATDGLPDSLLAAYREGLGLTAVTLIASGDGARLVAAAADAPIENAETVHAGWWCKSAQQAEWLVDAVVRAGPPNADAAQLGRTVLRAAKRLGIKLRSDEDIATEAIPVIARLEQEIAAQQRAGALKSVNRAYRDYRLGASARGEKVLRYAEWMARYKAKLMRDIAQNLRLV
jgi:hypothetical protein